MDVRPRHLHLGWALLLVGLVLVVATGLVLAYDETATLVQVSVDGVTETIGTHQDTVDELLQELELVLQPEDRLTPPPETDLQPGMAVHITRARLVELHADGERLLVRTHARTAGDVLEQSGVWPERNDELLLEGELITPDTELPPSSLDGEPPTIARGHLWDGRRAAPVRLSLHRAVPITVDDGGVPLVIQTTAPTIGEALLREEITVYLGDQVTPSLGSPVWAGQRVFIERSTPIVIRADGRTIKTRTREETVGNALSEQSIAVVGMDRVSPDLGERLEPNSLIDVTRVREESEIEQVPIPFDSIWVADDGLELDLQRLDDPGQEGLTAHRYRVTYENGQEVTRTLEYTWMAQQPITRVLAYGRKVVTRTMETAEGPLVYWRKIRMSATSYSASTAGVSPDNSHYGFTRLGEPMRKGIVAVDPAVIRLGSQLYVPGYGLGKAGDTGGAIQGRRVDLGYDDHNLILWRRWVDVYLLAPAPPSYTIKWVLPNWPRE